MMGSRFLGRAIVFGLGYLAGTRAGRERYAQIEAGARVDHRDPPGAIQRVKR